MENQITNQVLQVIQNHNRCSASGIAQILNVKTVTVLRSLIDLIKAKRVRKRCLVDDGHVNTYEIKRPMFAQLKLYGED